LAVAPTTVPYAPSLHDALPIYSRVQRTGEGRLLVRTDVIEGAAQTPPIGAAPPSERETIETALAERFGPLLDSDGNVTNRFIELDRKSTRLNSSHVKISYAVFC